MRFLWVLVIALSVFTPGCAPDKQVNAALWKQILATDACLNSSWIEPKSECSFWQSDRFRQFCAGASDAQLRSFLGQELECDGMTKLHQCDFGNASQAAMALFTLQYLSGKRYLDYQGDCAELKSYIAEQLRQSGTAAFVIVEQICVRRDFREAIKKYYNIN